MKNGIRSALRRTTFLVMVVTQSLPAGKAHATACTPAGQGPTHACQSSPEPFTGEGFITWPGKGRAEAFFAGIGDIRFDGESGMIDEPNDNAWPVPQVPGHSEDIPSMQPVSGKPACVEQASTYGEYCNFGEFVHHVLGEESPPEHGIGEIVSEEHPHHEDHGVSTVPVPSALWLFGSGLLGLAGLARRRNHQIHGLNG